MILDLPDIRDTVCGQEVIAEGKVEGAMDQLRTYLRAFAIKKFGPLPVAVEAGIHKLDHSLGDELFDRLFEMRELGDLEHWLREHSAL